MRLAILTRPEIIHLPTTYPISYAEMVTNRIYKECNPPLLVLILEELNGGEQCRWVPLLNAIDNTMPKRAIKWNNKFINQGLFPVTNRDYFNFDINGYFTDELIAATVKL